MKTNTQVIPITQKTEANCRGCFEGSHYRPKPITNYDRIVSKTPEELAEFLQKNRGGCRALTTESYVCDFYTENLDTDCKACWLDWLRKEGE